MTNITMLIFLYRVSRTRANIAFKRDAAQKRVAPQFYVRGT
jgi:hypothetical protein